jgi:hypothetical protein
MNYFHEDLGERHQGEAVVVSVPRTGFIRLLDQDNYRLFRIGKRHQYNGGPITDSGLRVRIPARGHWHVVVVMPNLTPDTCEHIEVLTVTE